LQSVTKRRPAARHDADLVEVSVLTVRGNQRVAGFMIGDAALFPIVQTTAPAFGTGNDFLDCCLHVALGNFPSAHGEQLAKQLRSEHSLNRRLQSRR
jgi:hypothetical protein